MDKRTEYAAWQKVTAPASSAGNMSVPPSPFDAPLPASVLNIEARSRANLFPWRGQCSPQLVEALLRAYAPPGSGKHAVIRGRGQPLGPCSHSDQRLCRVPWLVSGLGFLAAVLFAMTALQIFGGAQVTPTTSPLPFHAYPVFVATMAGWIWALAGARGRSDAP
jgi:hypothetical protein